MKIRLVSIGKTNSKTLNDIIFELEKRLPNYISFERIELSDVKNANNLSKNELLSQEATVFCKHLDTRDFLVILDEKGKQMTSIDFAGYLQNHMNISTKNLVFLIGGAYGINNELKQKAQFSISFSKMTFTHQMIRLFFVEQLYRAFTIIEGKPYHNT